MELRQLVDILRRRWWLVAEAIVIVGLVAGALTTLKTDQYRAVAEVLLRPNDPNERVDGLGVEGARSPERYAAAQADIVRSEAVLEEALKTLGPLDPETGLGGSIGAAPAIDRDVLRIAGTSEDPARARDLANAFARAYIENRRQQAVAGLEKAIGELETKLIELQARIAELDAQIGDGGLDPSVVAAIVRPTPGVEGPSGIEALEQLEGRGGLRTENESLKAARFAAAVQYQELFQRQQELEVERNLKRGEAELLSLAGLPTDPINAGPVRNGILGAFVGLLLGLGVVFLLEQFDDRIRTREDVERAVDSTVVATLPYDKDADRNHSVALLTNPLGTLAESTRTLRTSVQFFGIDEPVRRLLVTSPEPNEGKTMVAANLAVSYAKAGYRTVLVSADLRRPSVEGYFGFEPAHEGITTLITDLRPDGRLAKPAANGNGNGNGHHGEASLWERALACSLRPDGAGDLFVLPCGPLPPNPSELLASRRFASLVDELAREADMVVIDSPPVLAVTDAAVLAERSDAVLVVVAAEQSKRGPLIQALDVLDKTRSRVMGVALNKADPDSVGHYQGYYGYYTADAGKSRGLFGRKTRSSHPRLSSDALDAAGESATDEAGEVVGS